MVAFCFYKNKKWKNTNCIKKRRIFIGYFNYKTHRLGMLFVLAGYKPASTNVASSASPKTCNNRADVRAEHLQERGNQSLLTRFLHQ